MVDVFDQVEEELRSDRYKRLARKWLPLVGGVLLVALVAALAWWGWDRAEAAKADKASVAYQRGLEFLQANDPGGADTAFAQAIREGNGVYKAMALNHRAGIAMQNNRIPEAVTLFDEAAKTFKDPLLADAAAYKAALLLIDTAPLADIQARLEPLTEEDRPFRPFAQEALAFAQLQHGKIAEARSALVILKTGLDTPQIVAQRADAALSSIDAGTAANLAAIVKQQAVLEAAAEQERRARTAAQAAGQGQGQPSATPSSPSTAPVSPAPAARP